MKSRGLKGLADRYRPALLSEIIGHEKLVRGLQEKWETKRPLTYLFSGESGSGKTTIARIMAVSANCTHQDLFGEPCLKCRKNKNQFDIEEINASSVTGVEGIKSVTSAYDYVPTPPGKMRVYILDEAQRLSDASQNYLLKPFEDGPASTLWIICTTNPLKILPTLRGRCTHWHLASFGSKNTTKLVQEVIRSERANGNYQEQLSEKLVEQFVDNLVQQRIRTPRNILTQLEKFLVEKDPNCITSVDLEGDVRLGRLILEGSWLKVKKYVSPLTDDELNVLRYSLLSYFRAIVLKEGRGQMAKKCAEAIELLASAGSYDEKMTGYKVLAALYKLCDRFAPRVR